MSDKDSKLTKEQIAALEAGFALEGTIVLGDYVRTPNRHDHMGRVYMVHHTCPESPGWVKGLSIPVPEEKLLQPWVSILQHGGGAVVVPISDAVRIPPIPGFTHTYASMYFRDEPEPARMSAGPEKVGLYDALVVLCQTQGITTEHTYDMLHRAVESILPEPDE
jgi:hypothetical protein